MQNNGETVYFDQPLPKVHFMKMLSCSLYNSWDTLKNEVGLVDKKIVLLDLFPNWPLAIMILIVWQKISDQLQRVKSRNKYPYWAVSDQ